MGILGFRGIACTESVDVVCGVRRDGPAIGTSAEMATRVVVVSDCELWLLIAADARFASTRWFPVRYRDLGNMRAGTLAMISSLSQWEQVGTRQVGVSACC